jgi:RNA-binding protein with serine-rich domain 1
VKPSRIHIGRLTRNVTKDHVIEIFSTYGEIKNVEYPVDRFHPQNGRGFCYVEYVNPDDAENAMKHMDGGQIDGNEVTAAPVLHPKPMGMRRSPMRRGGPPPMRNRGGGGGGGWRNDMRNRNNRNERRSPDRRDRSRRSPRRR